MADWVGRIGLPELLVGVPFPAAALETVRFSVRPEKLPTLVYGGQTLPPCDALSAGLVDEGVAPDAFYTRSEELARQLARIPPPVFQLTKHALRAKALERMDMACKGQDEAALSNWPAPDTHAHIREYLRRTLGK